MAAVTAMFPGQLLTHYEPALHAARWHAAHALTGLSIALTIGQLARTLRYGALRLTEIFYEWRYGIVSGGEILASELGFTEKACHDYQATSYIRFRQLMKQIPIRANEDVFLDFGSGLGRAVILAATYPFRKVIGVELSTALHNRAVENVRRAAARLDCRDIELYNMDARRFRIPPEATIVYMWNPFDGEVLREVVANIHKSILEYPRKVTVLHLSPIDPTPLDVFKETLPWLHETKRIRFGTQSLAVFYTCGAAEGARSPAAAGSRLAQAV